MKRWILLTLVVIVVVAAGLFAFRQYQTPTQKAAHSGLLRTPNSAYKYDLCTEALAFAHASSTNPYKTDYTFKDPFRQTEDTIVPYLLDFDPVTGTVNFQVDVIIKQVATFHEVISNVHELDGISVIVPDMRNQPHHSEVPQFIVSSLGKGHVAVLDFTCPEQWVWKPARV